MRSLQTCLPLHPASEPTNSRAKTRRVIFIRPPWSFFKTADVYPTHQNLQIEQKFIQILYQPISINFPSQMHRQLQQYINTLPLSIAPNTYLFSTQKQSHFTANTAAQHLHRLYAQAAILGATSHSGRRTWLTELSSKGVGVRVLAEMAGHASIQTTQRYIDVNDEQMRSAAELI